jgi:hypothetical protein
MKLEKNSIDSEKKRKKNTIEMKSKITLVHWLALYHGLNQFF